MVIVAELSWSRTQHTPYLFGQLLYWFEYLRTTQMLGRLGTTPRPPPGGGAAIRAAIRAP